jgi:hypothetical protein
MRTSPNVENEGHLAANLVPLTNRISRRETKYGGRIQPSFDDEYDYASRLFGEPMRLETDYK